MNTQKGLLENIKNNDYQNFKNEIKIQNTSFLYFSKNLFLVPSFFVLSTQYQKKVTAIEITPKYIF